MADKTSIEWTDASWPVVTGCDHISAGCDNCYAAKLTGGRLKHLPAYEGLAEKGRFNGKVRLLPDRLNWPLKWRKARKIFVSDMADLFHKDVPDDYIAQVFAVMSSAPQHSFQVLTKRHARMRSLLSSPDFRPEVAYWAGQMCENGDIMHDQAMFGQWPLPNVWLGVSVENQQWAEARIPALLETPAAVRFISAEPLLGPVDLQSLKVRNRVIDCLGGDVIDPSDGAVLCGTPSVLDWVIAGGESGPGARPMSPDWAGRLRDECVSAGVPYFFKQWGSWAPSGWHGIGRPLPGSVFVGDEVDAAGHRIEMARVGKKAAGRLLDGRTWDQFPDTKPQGVVAAGVASREGTP